MKAEYKYIVTFIGFIILWNVLPLAALVATIIITAKTFRDIRNNRKANEYSQKVHKHDRNWARMEGFEI